MSNNKLVFLGGTAGNNDWRTVLTKELASRDISPLLLFNPVVADWNAEAQANEERAKATASHLLFYIADPKQPGGSISAYSLVEATMALYDKPDRTVVVFDTEGMEGHPLKAINQARKVLSARFPDARIFGNRNEAVDWLISELA